MSFERKPNGDIEFSWVKGRLNGQNILSEVRDQHDQSSCVMYAASAGVEMAILRKLAMREPATSTDLRFNVRRLIQEYERSIGCTLAEDSLERIRQRGATWREEELLDLFQDHGAFARSADWSGERKVKLEGYEVIRFPDFDTLAKAIAEGKPILGNLPVGPEFRHLKPDAIYQFNANPNVTRTVTTVHMVLFVGFGFRNPVFNSESDLTSASHYLVFMHSGGIGFADQGFGRVFFSQVYRDRFYMLSADPPAFLPDHRIRQDCTDASTSGTTAIASAPRRRSTDSSTSGTTATSPPRRRSPRRQEDDDRRRSTDPSNSATTATSPPRRRSPRRQEDDDQRRSTDPSNCGTTAIASGPQRRSPRRQEDDDRPRQRRRLSDK